MVGEQGRSRNAELLGGTRYPLCWPHRQLELRGGQGTHAALSPLTELSLLSCSVPRLFQL